MKQDTIVYTMRDMARLEIRVGGQLRCTQIGPIARETYHLGCRYLRKSDYVQAAKRKTPEAFACMN
jgi:hypothetical protein